MAEDKKKVIVYADWMAKFEALEDGEAGRLIKHFFRYINDLNPKYPDRITELSFIDIQNTLKRDLKKWEKRAENSRENGKLGGRPTNPNKPKQTQQVILKPKEPVNVSVNGNVSDSVSVNDKVIKKINVRPHVSILPEEIIKLQEKFGRDGYEWMADKLNSFKGSNGKKYKSDYLAILNWVVDAWNENKNKNGKQTSKVDGYKQSAERILRERGIDTNDFIEQHDNE